MLNPASEMQTCASSHLGLNYCHTSTTAKLTAGTWGLKSAASTHLYWVIYLNTIQGYVKVWFDNAGSHLSGMTECVLRLSILGGVLGALRGQGEQSFPTALVWCGIPSQMPGLPCFPCCHKFGPTVQQWENCILRSPHWPVWSSLLKREFNTIKHHSNSPVLSVVIIYCIYFLF